MENSEDKMAKIDAEIQRLQSEKARIEKELEQPKIERAIHEYLSNTNYGRNLKEHYNLDEEGIWEIRGEDPNCDFGGTHIQPLLGFFQGTLKDALRYALAHPSFYSWGGGGRLSKITMITTKDL